MAGNVNFSFRRQAQASHSIIPALHGVASVGRPGLPSSMQRFIQHKLKPRMGDIYSDETQIYQSPFNTPAMLANQARVLQNECAVDPTSPACYTAKATGDIVTGGNPAADAVYSLKQYCQNIQGFTTDPQCNGTTPTAAAMAAAQSVGFTPQQVAAQQAYYQQTGQLVGSAQANISTGGGSGTQGGGPVMTVTPKPAVPAAPPTTQAMPNINTANTAGTSGGPTGSLLNGQPVSGAATTTTTDYAPYLMAAAVAVVLIMVSK